MRTARRIFEGNVIVPARALIAARSRARRQADKEELSRLNENRSCDAAACSARAPGGSSAQPRRSAERGLRAGSLPDAADASLLVPYAAGGGTDAIARLVAQGVGEKLGQTLIVENNGSAGGNVATPQAATAEPDGYTVLMANQGPMVVNPHLFKNVKVDPLTAFDPMTLITAAPLVVVVPQNSPHKTIRTSIEHSARRTRAS